MGEDKTKYRLLTKEYVKVVECDGRKILKVDPAGLELLSKAAYSDVSFYLRAAHLQKLRNILEDPEATDNDKFVAYTMLLNQTVAAEGELPTCQDTGTAICIGKKGENVFTGADDAECIARGAYEAYKERNLRYSQVVPFTMTEEKNSGTNLPAQIDLYADKGNEYKFLFITKGGGSANKTFLYQQTKALLNEKSLLEFFRSKLMDLGTSACPPYHLAVCIGGTSAEMCLATVKKASAGYLDQLPTSGNEGGRCFRDLEWEQKILQICRESGIGAQFGGKYLVHDVRVIRLPRHSYQAFSVSIPQVENGHYLFTWDLFSNKRSPVLQKRMTREVTVEYIPLHVTLLRPAYRNNLYATMPDKTIEAQIELREDIGIPLTVELTGENVREVRKIARSGGRDRVLFDGAKLADGRYTLKVKL